MKSGIERAIEKLGIPVTVENTGGLKRGKGIVYPLRYRARQWGNVEHLPQGRTEPGRFLLFCARELVKDAAYGSMIFEGGNRYALIWKDEYGCGLGGYARICMRKMKGASGT